jgi:peptidase propeptide and YPEB domain protein
VLNAGWNLKTNGNQTAAITNGKGLDFASDDNSVTITPTVDKDGNAKVNFSVNATNAINGVKGNVTAAKVDGDQAGKVTVSDADKGKLATVDTVAEAINSAATFVKVADSQEVIKKSTDDDNGVAVKSGDTVTHTAGKNLKVKRDGKSITYALAQDIDVNSVTIGSGDNATKITSDDKGLNLAGKDGAATNINNVKDADLNSTSKQAVNGSQLYATNEKVANLGTTVNNLSKVINHHAGAIDSLDRKVNKHSKQARAGIAGANAAAALPQAYTQGKAMVAAAAGTFKGQNALAVGYSRISDNGKVILKLQGNANTSGDVGAGVGVGYQW